MNSVIVNFNVKDNKLVEFLDILNSVQTDLPKVEGCLGVDVFRSTSHVNMFTLVETWETKQLHQDHISKLTEDGTWEFISKHLSDEPESDYYEKL